MRCRAGAGLSVRCIHPPLMTLATHFPSSRHRLLAANQGASVAMLVYMPARCRGRRGASHRWGHGIVGCNETISLKTERRSGVRAGLVGPGCMGCRRARGAPGQFLREASQDSPYDVNPITTSSAGLPVALLRMRGPPESPAHTSSRYGGLPGQAAGGARRGRGLSRGRHATSRCTALASRSVVCNASISILTCTQSRVCEEVAGAVGSIKLVASLQ